MASRESDPEGRAFTDRTLQFDPPTMPLDDLPGVGRVNNRGQLQELKITEGCDPQEILAAVMSRAKVRHFELASPSLHDIFVRIAGPEAEENGHAQDS